MRIKRFFDCDIKVFQVCYHLRRFSPVLHLLTFVTLHHLFPCFLVNDCIKSFSTKWKMNKKKFQNVFKKKKCVQFSFDIFWNSRKKFQPAKLHPGALIPVRQALLALPNRVLPGHVYSAPFIPPFKKQ